MEVTSELLFQIIGAKEVELSLLRVKVAQLEAHLATVSASTTDAPASDAPLQVS